MFLLFINLYQALLIGSWQPFDNLNQVFGSPYLQNFFNQIGEFITSIFGDNKMITLGTGLGDAGYQGMTLAIALILALITSIGIVVMAVKGIKRAFGIFFMGIRR